MIISLILIIIVGKNIINFDKSLIRSSSSGDINSSYGDISSSSSERSSSSSGRPSPLSDGSSRSSPSTPPCGCPRPSPIPGEDFSSSLLSGMPSPPPGSSVGRSSCNYYTDLLGAGQDVLSYSYYTPGTVLHTKQR